MSNRKRKKEKMHAVLKIKDEHETEHVHNKPLVVFVDQRSKPPICPQEVNSICECRGKFQRGILHCANLAKYICLRKFTGSNTREKGTKGVSKSRPGRRRLRCLKKSFGITQAAGGI